MATFIMENFWLIVMVVLLMLIDIRLAVSFVAIVLVRGYVDFWVMVSIVAIAWCLGTYRNQFYRRWLRNPDNGKENNNDHNN